MVSFHQGAARVFSSFLLYDSCVQTAWAFCCPKVQILAVHIQSGLFQRKLSRKQLKVRVKYGAPGVSIHCDTAQAKLSHQAAPAAARFVHRLDRPDQERIPKPMLFGEAAGLWMLKIGNEYPSGPK
jgi:hypothetical protein